MSPSSLSLFPAPSTGPPRKISLRRIRTDNIPDATGEINMKGVAFQVLSSPKAAKIQPAAEAIKHSLFCTPLAAETATMSPDSFYTSSPGSSTRSLIRRQSRTRRRSTPITIPSAMSTPATSYAMSPSMSEDELAPLPINTYFGSGTPPKRCRSAHIKRPTLPPNISTPVQPRRGNFPITPVDEKIDSLSPLPDMTRFKPSPQAAFPHSIQAADPAPLHQTETSTYGSPIQSIFPQYDHSKPMDRQSYYPTARATPPHAYMRDNVSKTAASSIERHVLKRNDSAVGIFNHYEHVPIGAHADLQALWKASCDDFPVAAKKVQFGLYQPASYGKSLAIGTSSGDLMYTMERDLSGPMPGPKSFVVKKHCPTAPDSSPVMHLVLPTRSESHKGGKEVKERTFIFPQAAAVNAISAVMNSPEAHHIATYDPAAQSVQAAHLAQDAVAMAQSRFECQLVKKARKRDSLGSVTASYDLHHPTLGHCAVTVTKSISISDPLAGPLAKISLHHPSATPAAVAAETLNLASLDFANDACVLDMPALLTLDSHYVLDTVIGTLLAVALVENDALVAESIVFEPPPKTPIKPGKAHRRASMHPATSSPSSSSRSLFKRKEKKAEKVDFDLNEQVELPGLARGALKVMEFGFKAGAFVIIAGVKVGLKVGTSIVERVAATK